MSGIAIKKPFEVFADSDGSPLESGFIYIGSKGLNPETNPIAIYWDAGMTIPAAQPVRTIAGYAMRNGSPGTIYTATAYSITVRNKIGGLVYSSTSDTTEYVVDSIASLRLITGTAGSSVQPLGYYSSGDGGGGPVRVWATGGSGTYTDNGGSIIVPTGGDGSGAWVGVAEDMWSSDSFGVINDGITDCTTRLTAFFAYINAVKKGTFVVSPGTYLVTPVISGVLFSFSNLDGVHIIATGVTYKDSKTTYALGEVSQLFKFTNCSNIKMDRATYKSEEQSAWPDVRGMTFVDFVDLCVGIDFEAVFVGGNKGVRFTAPNASPTLGARQIKVKIKANNIEYPFMAQCSGYDSEVWIDTDTCGRNFFINGTKRLNINVSSKNQKGASIIGAYGGRGVEDLFLSYYDKDSTSSTAGNEAIIFQYGDATAAEFRNIDILLDVQNNAAAPFGSTLLLSKYDNTGAADSTGRGHLFDNIKIRGFSGQQPGVAHMGAMIGSFAAPDEQRGVSIEDLLMTGSTSVFNLNLAALTGTASFKNVKSAYDIYAANPTGTTVVFSNVSASNLTSSTADTSGHDYYSCKIAGGSRQSRLNKRIFNSSIGGTDVSPVFVGSFTRDMTTETGTQAITGVGFKPRYVKFEAVRDASTEWASGMDSGTSAKCAYDNHPDIANTRSLQPALSIYMFEGAGVAYGGKISSMDTDGFTMSWTRTGAKAGIVTVLYTAYR